MTTVLTPENLRTILGGQPAKPQPILQGTYTNYTPLMLGDYRARHFRCRDRSCDTIEASLGHAAQAIRGKARWLTRVALASLRGCNRDYTRIERECGAVELQGVGRVGLVELMFGSITGAQLASPFTLKARTVIVGRREYSSPWARGTLLPTRMHLITMGADEVSKKLLDAWKPGMLQVEVEVGLASHWSRLLGRVARPEDHSRVRSLPCFYAALVAATPLLLGLGKATTRGFGRFKPVNLEARATPCAREAASLLKTVIENITSLVNAGSMEATKKRLADILDAIIGLAELSTGIRREEPSSGSGPDWGFVPRLSITLGKLEVVDAHCMGVRNHIDALRVIGEVSLKQTWKQVAGRSKESGLPFHSWPLGMPRKSLIPCKCREYERKAPKERKGLYGYIIADERIVNKYGLKEGNTCLEDERCLQTGERTVHPTGSREGKEKEKPKTLKLGDENVRLEAQTIAGGETVNVRVDNVSAKDVRHQSMVVMFPLPSRSSLIALLFFPSYGLNLNIDRDKPQPVNGLKLLHLGGHMGRIGKFPPCCNTHVVDVAKAIRISPVIAPKTGPKECGCGKDRGGICMPSESSGSDCRSCNSDCYRRAVESAYEWIVYILKNCGRHRGGEKL
ncbi:MAG: hypothetical protein GXO15_05395 [Crenarchaeota archaeon]|nr:hypothetical protein [Thermoproteota archaeon]